MDNFIKNDQQKINQPLENQRDYLESAKIHLQHEWNERVIEDGVFQDIKDPSKWIVDQSNILEMIEAIKIQNFVDQSQIASIIDQKGYVEVNGEKSIKYNDLISILIEKLIVEINVPFKELFDIHFSIPIDRISKFLNMLKHEFMTDPNNQVKQFYLEQIKFTLRSMNERGLFNSSQEEIKKIVEIQQKSNNKKTQHTNLHGRMSVRLQWMNEFSDIGLEMQNQQALQLIKQRINFLNIPESLELENESNNRSDSNNSRRLSKRQFSRTESLIETETLQKYQDLLIDCNKLHFNIFEFLNKVPREKVLPILAFDAFCQMDLLEMINEKNFGQFLNQINNIYRKDVQYHNDLHGADVMLFCNYMLNECQLQKTLKLNKLDCLSMMTAALCHDLGHDGFTNSYHVNAITKRAIDSNDQAVQESFHVAELFRQLAQNHYNFTDTLDRDEFKLFRKRVIGLILATDMARHAADLAALNQIINENSINNNPSNINLLLDVQDQTRLFKNQQIFMEIALHAADISQGTRDFNVNHQWTYLLFEEFFEQGDIEKEQNLQISMLCDRNNTNVASSQPGFIGFVSLPVFIALNNIMPQFSSPSGCIERLKENQQKWNKYVENDDDKKVYLKKQKIIQNHLDAHSAISHFIVKNSSSSEEQKIEIEKPKNNH